MQSLWVMPIRGTLNFSRGVRLKIILNFPEHTLKDCVVYFKSSPQRQTVLWLTHEQRKMMRVFDFEEPLNIMIVFIKPVFMILNTQQFSYNLMNLNFTNFPCTTRTNIDHMLSSKKLSELPTVSVSFPQLYFYLACYWKITTLAVSKVSFTG